MIEYFLGKESFPIVFHSVNPNKKQCIYEDKNFIVSTIPLSHRVPTCGFLFEETPKPRHLIPEMLEAFNVPIRDRQAIKNGADFVDSEGFVVENSRLTTPPTPSRRYAYISDSLPLVRVAEQIGAVDCLFHEATYLNEHKERAKETLHSTAEQAAEIASRANAKRLVIGHFSARYRWTEEFLHEAQQVFGQTILAKDGLVVEF